MQSASAATALEYYPKPAAWRESKRIDFSTAGVVFEAAGLEKAAIGLESVSISSAA